MIQTETTPNPESLKFLCENTFQQLELKNFKKMN